jgi:hypothetical protein
MLQSIKNIIGAVIGKDENGFFVKTKDSFVKNSRI